MIGGKLTVVTVITVVTLTMIRTLGDFLPDDVFSTSSNVTILKLNNLCS
jgi:hypothetical protein